ncbi:hypothetical protein M5K25_005049 [Dendrobium thyrsiflorum]|uniref:non-specific serine/threonine protein kinase n=1 Tax=Dendrobium thyrsiflorum TaxID=117978 RepID=A0ABD0VHP5_DENTH
MHHLAQVLSHKGYDGAIADTWSCGVILYVLLAGYLPFDEVDLGTLYCKIEKAEFSCPSWFSIGAKSLVHRILDPNPDRRIRIDDIKNDDWFMRNYVPSRYVENEDVNLDDVYAVFDDPEEQQACESFGNDEAAPLVLNAFDLFSLSQGLNLSALFERRQDNVKHQTRFLSRKPAKVLLSSIEVIAQSMGLKTHIRNYKVIDATIDVEFNGAITGIIEIVPWILYFPAAYLCAKSIYLILKEITFFLPMKYEVGFRHVQMRVEGLSADRTSHFSVMLEIFEVAPSIFMVDIQRAAGDTEEYFKVSTLLPCSASGYEN